MDELRTANVSDLTVEQLTDLELDPKVDAPMDSWALPRSEGGPRSKVYLQVRILAFANDVDPAKLQALSLNELMGLVQLQDDEEDPT